MKKHTLQFTDCDTAELWEILPEFADTVKTYQDFMDAVYKLYPGSDSEQRWAIADMDKLVGETSWVGILSLTDLGRYHREFMAITTFLITKNCISPAKQSRVFAHGFPPELWNRVATAFNLNFLIIFPMTLILWRKSMMLRISFFMAPHRTPWCMMISDKPPKPPPP